MGFLRRLSVPLALSGVLVYGSSSWAQDASRPVEPDVVEIIEVATTDTEGDVTETIGSAGGVTEAIGDPSGGAGPSVQALASAAPSNAELIRTKVSGWARESLEFYPYDQGLRRADPSDVLRVPRDRALARTQLLVRASYQRGAWFEATVSGSLGVIAALNDNQVQDRLDPQLRELYLGFFGERFDLRLGQQRVAWGVADIFSPNDVINARDLRDPFLAEPEMNRLPTPLARLSWYQGPLTLEALVAPVFVPDRSDLYGRNWAAIQPDAPAAVRGLFALLAHNTDPSVRAQLNDALYQTQLPNLQGRGVTPSVKLGLHTASLDLNLYYQYGYDSTPYLWQDPSFASVLNSTDFSNAGLATLAPVLRAVDGGITPLVAEYVRRHHAGFDAVVPMGPVMLRLDAAYQSRRVFYRSELTSIANPAALGVVSLDYQTGSIDKVLVVEGVYIRILEDYSGPLLVYMRDSYGLAGVMRWPLFSVFSLEARTMIGIQPRFYMAQPSLIMKLGSFAIKAGGLVLNGQPNSFGGYYRHNTTAFLQARYGF